MHQRQSGFTLIEMLVVISIIALLIGILLPALGKARRSAQVVASASNQRQIVIGVAAYATDNNGAIPVGPGEAQNLFVPAFVGTWGNNPQTDEPRKWNEIATNQIFISAYWTASFNPPDTDGALHAQGLLLAGNYFEDARVVFSPGDDTLDPSEELAKFNNRNADPTQDAFGSYFYRQRDQTTKPYLEDLGFNGLREDATALIVDANSEQAKFASYPTPEYDETGNIVVDPTHPFHRTNHGGAIVTAGYNDGHISQYDNTAKLYTQKAEDNLGLVLSQDPTDTIEKLDEIFARLDAGNDGDDLDLSGLLHD